jgi:hypothetical protein
MTHGTANKRKVKLLRSDFQNVAEPLYRSSVHQIAANTIDRIGGIYDDTTFLQNLHHTGDFSWFWVDVMNGKKFGRHSQIYIAPIKLFSTKVFLYF